MDWKGERCENSEVLKVALKKSHTNIWDEQPSDSASGTLLGACTHGSAPA